MLCLAVVGALQNCAGPCQRAPMRVRRAIVSGRQRPLAGGRWGARLGAVLDGAGAHRVLEGVEALLELAQRRRHRRHDARLRAPAQRVLQQPRQLAVPAPQPPVCRLCLTTKVTAPGAQPGVRPSRCGKCELRPEPQILWPLGGVSEMTAIVSCLSRWPVHRRAPSCTRGCSPMGRGRKKATPSVSGGRGFNSACALGNRNGRT